MAAARGAGWRWLAASQGSAGMNPTVAGVRGMGWRWLAVSHGPDLPAGATTILLAGAAYLLVVMGSGLLKRTRAANAERDR